MDLSSLDKTITDDHFPAQGFAKLFYRVLLRQLRIPRQPAAGRLLARVRRAHEIWRWGVAPCWEQALSDALNAIESGPAERLIALRESIARRARDCGRAPETVKLVAVSKTFSADEVWPTIATAGQTRFGENRVQEAIPKWRDLRARAAALGEAIELHLIGPLQSNKAREAVETFDVIETVDREKIAAALAREIDRVGKRPRLFVEINTGEEAQKAGVLPDDADAFIALCRQTYGLAIEGLMAIPPANELVSPHFALLGVIAERNGLAERSIGMSADWPLAVQLGATYVRVGSAIFGARDSHS